MNIPASIRFPSITLSDALQYGESLYKNAGRTPVDPEVAVKAMGYTSLNGAARTTMSALSSYAVLAKAGGDYRISDDFLKFIRPVTEQDKSAAARTMALRPALFASIHSAHRECNEHVLTSLLVHQGLVEDSAKKAARIYKANSAFAKLEEAAGSQNNELSTETKADSELPFSGATQERKSADLATARIPAAIPLTNVLAQYSIPLGGNEATLVFTGDTLVPDDFDALAEYVLLFKKQFARRQKPTPISAQVESQSTEK